MFKDFPLFPDRASTVAGQVDLLYLTLVSISVFFAVLISTLVVYFAVKYRRRSEHERPKEIHGSMMLEMIWTIIPFIIAMGVFAWGATIFYTIQRPPAGAMEMYGVGKQWMWKFEHPTGQREINQLHVPKGRAIKMTLASEDVIHSFYVPAFRVKADAVPGRYRTIWFEPTRTGRYHLFCAEYCGTRHAGMIGWVTVMEPAEYEAWLSGIVPGQTMADSGEKIFQQLGCITCHRDDGTGRGPVLDGVYGKEIELEGGMRVLADETYLRESIVNPQAKVVSGFKPVMPTYQGLISEEGLLQLVAYLKSLKAPATAEPSAIQTPIQTTEEQPRNEASQ